MEPNLSRQNSHHNVKHNRTTEKISICPTTITHIYRHGMVSTAWNGEYRDNLIDG